MNESSLPLRSAANSETADARRTPNSERISNEGQQTSTQSATRNPKAESVSATSETGERCLTSLQILSEQVEAELHSEGALETTDGDSVWPKDFKLSIVIPVYNEENTIEELLNRVLSLAVPKEVIVVDDHSTDETAKILRQFEGHADLHVFFKPENQGKGAALRTGFRQACGDIITIQDADLEYPPEQLLTLLPPILSGESDVVYGSRFVNGNRQDRSWVHRAGNGFLTWMSNRTTGLKLTDMETCHKAFRRDAIRSMKLEQNRFGFEPEITAKLARRGFHIQEVPIEYSPRGFSEGKKIGWKDLISAIYCIWRYGHQE